MQLRGTVKILDDGYKVGDIVKVKFITIHKMDTGFTKDKESGKSFPRFFMKEAVASFEGKEVARFTFDVALSQNPAIVFPLKVTGAGELVVDFLNSEGEKAQKKVLIKPTE